MLMPLIRPKSHQILLSAEARNHKMQETHALKIRRQQLMHMIAELEKSIDDAEECQEALGRKKEALDRCSVEKKVSVSLSSGDRCFCPIESLGVSVVFDSVREPL